MQIRSYKGKINIKNVPVKVALTLFDYLIHKLMIEEGRHYRPKTSRENRFCKICKETVEDEQHMLTNCKLYGQRHNWFNKISEKYQTLEI